MNLNNRLTDTLDQIASSIYAKYILRYNKEGQLNQETNLDNGLMSGHLGVSLFCMYYSQLFNKSEFHTYALDILDYCLLNVQEYKAPSFCSGLAGLAWTLNHYQNNNWVDSQSYTFNILDKYLETASFDYLKSGKYDYLHGGIGIGLYYLEKDNSHDFFAKSLELIEKCSVSTDSGIYWVKPNSSVTTSEQEEINFSLSHGISSIILYLAKIYKSGFCKNESKQLIEKSIDFLMQHKYHDQQKCVYPSHLLFNTSSLEYSSGFQSRLAWCYGDLGLAASLLQIGNILDSSQIYDLGNEIGIHTLSRQSFADTGIVDAGICHGYFGIALVYQELFELTSNSKFSVASDIWFEKGLDDLDQNSIKKFKYKRGKDWIETDDLLLGTSGIGLSIINRLYQTELSNDNSNWKTLLMMS